MKTRSFLIPLFALAFGLGAMVTSRSQEASVPAPARVEYVTLRWDGRDNTHVIYADGKVEFLREQFAGIRRPPKTDERAYYLTLAMNALAAKGYDFAGRTDDEIVMRRAGGH